MKNLKHYDAQLYYLLEREKLRQNETINLIASENYAPHHLFYETLVGSNKYAEGTPGKRYYAGCDIVDKMELLAQERCRALFKTDYHCNVQPHAGSQANMAAYFALLKPGDTILGMSLREGGHLTHGHAINFSGIWYKSASYGVDPDTEMLDYDHIEALAHQYRPALLIAGASAYSRFIDFKRFKAIAQSVGAYLLADIAHIAGLIASGVHPSPFPYVDVATSTTHKTLRGPRGGLLLARPDLASAVDRAVMPGVQGGPFMHVIAEKALAFELAQQDDFVTYSKQVISNAALMADCLREHGYRIVSGGTDNHLFIVDLTDHHITGKEAEDILASIGITVSRSCIPYDQKQPWITSGIRLGTPAMTTRGMGHEASRAIVHLIHEVLCYRHDMQRLIFYKDQVRQLARAYPLTFPYANPEVYSKEDIFLSKNT
ncbi:MAG: serine hydroxymethyltransferase [Candidatus Babeliales bacterium]